MRAKLDREFKFITHLQQAIASRQLIPIQHKTGDWLRLLTDAQTNELTAIVELGQHDLDAGDAIFALVLNLFAFETGRYNAAAQLIQQVEVFILLLRLDRLRRYGLIELPKMPSLDDDAGLLTITEKGQQFADQFQLTD